MSTAEQCPDCQSPLFIDRQARVGVAEWRPDLQQVVERRVRADVAFCSGCEWALELRRVHL